MPRFRKGGKLHQKLLLIEQNWNAIHWGRLETEICYWNMNKSGEDGEYVWKCLLINWAQLKRNWSKPFCLRSLEWGGLSSGNLLVSRNGVQYNWKWVHHDRAQLKRKGFQLIRHQKLQWETSVYPASHVTISGDRGWYDRKFSAAQFSPIGAQLNHPSSTSKFGMGRRLGRHSYCSFTVVLVCAIVPTATERIPSCGLSCSPSWPRRIARLSWVCTTFVVRDRMYSTSGYLYSSMAKQSTRLYSIARYYNQRYTAVAWWPAYQGYFTCGIRILQYHTLVIWLWRAPNYADREGIFDLV